MVNIVLLKEEPQRVKISPTRGLKLRSVASRKVVYREVSTEVSEPVKVGTDEQKPHRWLGRLDKVATHTNVQKVSNHQRNLSG